MSFAVRQDLPNYDFPLIDNLSYPGHVTGGEIRAFVGGLGLALLCWFRREVGRGLRRLWATAFCRGRQSAAGVEAGLGGNGGTDNNHDGGDGNAGHGQGDSSRNGAAAISTTVTSVGASVSTAIPLFTFGASRPSTAAPTRPLTTRTASVSRTMVASTVKKTAPSATAVSVPLVPATTITVMTTPVTAGVLPFDQGQASNQGN